MRGRKEIGKRLNKLRHFSRHDYQREPESVAAAAQFFKLDTHDARQRETLLYLLADVIFASSGKKGRRKGSKTAWGSSRLVTLGGLYGTMKYENPNLSDAKIAKLITNKHPEFKYDDPEQIRQKLRAAQQEFMDWCWEEARDHAAEFAADLTADRDDLYD